MVSRPQIEILPQKKACEDGLKVLGWPRLGGRVPHRPSHRAMSWGGQRKGEQRLGYAERRESSRAVYQPQEELSAHEHP